VIGRTKQEKLADSSNARQFSEKLPMSHPFGTQQGHAADKNKNQIKGGWMSDSIEQKSCQKHRCGNLMNRPDKDRKIQDPIGSLTDSAHFISRTPSLLLLFHHYISAFISPVR
jgi:hypothetical protein